MLTLSETWLTTHTSLSLLARTETGSRPTCTSKACTIWASSTLNTSIRLSAVFTAISRRPSGVASSGWTCGVSQLTKAEIVPAKEAVASATAATSTAGLAGAIAPPAIPAGRGVPAELGVG